MAIKDTQSRVRSSTFGRIVDAGRRLFNAKGYGETSLAQIAGEVGISQGNLTYHFPTKRQIAQRIQQDAQAEAAARRERLQPGCLAQDYVEHLLFAMDITWNHRFLFRDRAQFLAGRGDNDPSAALIADFDELHALILRIDAQGMFLANPSRDLMVLTRSLWIVSRYWMDYISEVEGLGEITWGDQRRGIEHHFAILLPCMTDEAGAAFQTALAEAQNSDWRAGPFSEKTASD